MGRASIPTRWHGVFLTDSDRPAIRWEERRPPHQRTDPGSPRSPRPRPRVGRRARHLRPGRRGHPGRPARNSAPRASSTRCGSYLEHIRIAQADILDFCINAAYAHAMRWPDDYWPQDAAPPGPQAWTDSLASYARDREALNSLARDVADLTATVPTGTGTQTYLRAILLTADHTAYHVGQIVAVRRALGLWPPV